MSLLKKCEAYNRLPASRNKSQGSFGHVRQADQANPSEMKPDVASAARLTFAEDFTLEHSLHSLLHHFDRDFRHFLNHDRA
jgi:hypothetical protein